MTAQEIIEKWLDYSKYNPDEHRFVLGSTHYEMHKISTWISKIMEFDPKCGMSVLYLKTKFEELCRNAKTTLFDVLSNNTGLDEDDIEMWQILHSEDVVSEEYEILDKMTTLIKSVTHQDQIGERDLEKERESLANAVIAVVEELCQCHVDLFLKGGVIQPIERINTQLHIFNTLSGCLLALEGAPDAAYICYIANNGTADGYFGFYIKSNGNILSINERINEAYPGQHNHTRNGRWAESKKINLFPYSLITGENFDYKGYARKLIIDDSELEIFKLAPDCYLPLTLGLIMLSNKYAWYDPCEMPLKYVDTLLPINLQLAEKKDSSLVPLQDSLIAKANAEYKVTFTSEKIMSGSPAASFTRSIHTEKDCNETGFFQQGKNIFVDLYGQGFQLDTQQLLIQSRYKELPATDMVDLRDYEECVEFVGTKDRLDMIAYFKCRQQLAEYIRDRMFEEYQQFGGAKAVQKWYDAQTARCRDRLIELCVRRWREVKTGEKRMPSSMNGTIVEKQGLDYILFCENVKGCLDYTFTAGAFRNRPFNNFSMKGKSLCPITGTTTSIHFVFRPESWKDMEEMFDTEVPKVLKGYIWNAYRNIGNSILNATDAVAEVGNVFEQNEHNVNRRLWTKSDWKRYYFHHHDEYPDWGRREPPARCIEESPAAVSFNIEIAFSKRGWAKVLKEIGTKKPERG